MPQLRFEQLMPVPLDKIFPFHADPYNLLKITPPSLGMRITNPTRLQMASGTEITYQIRWMGLPMNWRSRIIAYDPPHSFTDIQIKGPYKKWEHTHTFIAETDTTTRIIDDVYYELPMGFAGRLVAGALIRNQLLRIFEFRNQRLDEIFAAPR